MTGPWRLTPNHERNRPLGIDDEAEHHERRAVEGCQLVVKQTLNDPNLIIIV